MAAGEKSEEEDIEVTLTISRAAYDRAKAHAEDPNSTLLGEFAGMMDVEEFLGHFLEAHLEK